MTSTHQHDSAMGAGNPYASTELPPPPLNPAGIQLETNELASGVYALLSGHPVVDNSGFVVGQRGVLVIDAHINGAMARQIQDAVRQVTDKPILYLVNTNYHGDHTFGNYAFPGETIIVAHRETGQRMQDFQQEKQLMLRSVGDDPAVLADVQLRLPDLVFGDYCALDLGGRVVELYHFGPGNTPGDTVVYVPGDRVAWTGNLVLGEGTVPIPFLIEGGAIGYLETIARFAQTLEVETIIPGHGFPTSGAMFGPYLRYLSELIDSVRKATWGGQSLEETLASLPLGEQYAPPASLPTSVGDLFASVHRWNVGQTYLDLSGD